ncbi:MAG: lysophospholipase [Eubacterium sp.]|nr:lysophospholipase [Eubacterium sp.]
MRKSENYFESSNGINTVKYFVYESENVEPQAVIQFVHGMAEHIERYDNFFEFLTEQGFIVYGDNHIGHKDSVLSDDDLGYFCESDGWKCLVKDEHRLTSIIKKEHPDKKLFIYGHSMGSFITRAYITQYADEVCGAVISGSAGKNPALGAGKKVTSLITKLKGKRHRSGLITAMMFGSYNKRYKNVKSPYAWLTRDEKVVEEYEADKYSGFMFTTSAYMDLMNILDFVTEDAWYDKVPKSLPMLFIAGEMDPVGNWGQGYVEIDEKFSKRNMDDVTVRLYPEMRHELHNEIGKEKVWNDVTDWIKERN